MTKRKSKSERDRYLRSRYGITFEEWDFICGFYGNRCLYPGCEFFGNVYSLSVDHVYPDHLGGKSEISNYQPLCEYHNLYVKNGKYQEFRFDKGKKVLKALAEYKENRPFQLPLLLTTTKLAQFDQSSNTYQFQYGFDYIFSKSRQREIDYIKAMLKDLGSRKNCGAGILSSDYGYLNFGGISNDKIFTKERELIGRIRRIFEKQESFYVCPYENEPLGLQNELNKVMSIHSPWFFPLKIKYSELCTKWHEGLDWQYHFKIRDTKYYKAESLLWDSNCCWIGGTVFQVEDYVTESFTYKKEAETLLGQMENYIEGHIKSVNDQRLIACDDCFLSPTAEEIKREQLKSEIRKINKKLSYLDTGIYAGQPLE